MSVVEQIQRLSVPAESGSERCESDGSDQFKDLEEVEAALRGIGITLEPKFDISLAARIGARPAKD